MKLKASFITQDIDETLFPVPVGLRAFQGVIRGNKSAAFIVDCLKQETTEDAIVDKMYARYDDPQAGDRRGRVEDTGHASFDQRAGGIGHAL